LMCFFLCTPDFSGTQLGRKVRARCTECAPILKADVCSVHLQQGIVFFFCCIWGFCTTRCLPSSPLQYRYRRCLAPVSIVILFHFPPPAWYVCTSKSFCVRGDKSLQVTVHVLDSTCNLGSEQE